MTRSTLRLIPTAVLVLVTGCTVPPADPLEAAPRVTAFTTSASRVAPGGTVTLHWETTGATSVQIDELKLGTVSGVSGASGDVDVAVNADSTFVLRVRNGRGASDSAVVHVSTGTDSGGVVFTALPGTLEVGQSATLVWSAPGATTVTLTTADGTAIDIGSQTTSGSVVVSPAATTVYTLTASGLSATTTVTVAPTIVSFTNSALTPDAGNALTLSWVTGGATRLQLTSPGRGVLLDTMDAAAIAGGTFTDALGDAIDPSQYFTYELTVSSGTTSKSQTLVVGFAGSPVIVSFTAPALSRATDAGTLADGGVGASTIALTWQTREADALVITANGAELFRVPAEQRSAGTLTLPAPAASTTFALTASKTRGTSVTRTADVVVVGKPTIALTASPTQVSAGTPSTLQWTGTNVRTVTIIEDGFGALSSRTGALDTGTFDVAPGTDSTYTLVAGNGVGDQVSATVAVSVTNPISLMLSHTGTLREGQDVEVTFAVPGNPTATISGLSHLAVDTRTTMNFDDISTTGTRLVFAANTGETDATLVTDFRTILWGRVVGSEIHVSRHGVLAFGPLNGSNSVDEALPTSRLEPLAVAPYWDALTEAAGVFWQVKDVAGQSTLIVQWSMSTAVFEAKIAANGQIDFEYKTLPASPTGHSGITGIRPSQYVAGTPVVGGGQTFFGPRPSPVTLRIFEPTVVSGYVGLSGGGLLRLSAPITSVKGTRELVLNEVMGTSSLGPNGTWAEFKNASDTAADLTGWSLALPDAGAIALSGTVPPRGLLVVGKTTDGALNGDAGVQVAIPTLDLTGVTTAQLQRAGTHQSLTLIADAGVATVADPQNFAGSASTVCAASAAFGAQFGTPGSDTGCGFPYFLSPIAVSYFDISTTGSPVVVSNFDQEVNTVSLAAAPVPFFGTARTSVQVSTNGFLSFDTTAASTSLYLAYTTPSTTDANLVAALFAADLDMSDRYTDGQIFAQRVGPNVDPGNAAPHWIIQWHHWSRWLADDDLNFQVKLFDDGTVEYHYGRMVSGSSSQYGAGYTVTSWLENAAGTQALVVTAQSNNPGISPNSAFRFSPR